MVIYYLKKAKYGSRWLSFQPAYWLPCRRRPSEWLSRTNALYWAASTPNLGAEFRVNRHVTFNFEAAYNRIKVFNIDTRGAMITPEVRYWFSARPQAGHLLELPA